MIISWNAYFIIYHVGDNCYILKVLAQWNLTIVKWKVTIREMKYIQDTWYFHSTSLWVKFHYNTLLLLYKKKYNALQQKLKKKKPTSLPEWLFSWLVVKRSKQKCKKWITHCVSSITSWSIAHKSELSLVHILSFIQPLISQLENHFFFV